jgi:hypothetical protein
VGLVCYRGEHKKELTLLLFLGPHDGYSILLSVCTRYSGYNIRQLEAHVFDDQAHRASVDESEKIKTEADGKKDLTEFIVEL